MPDQNELTEPADILAAALDLITAAVDSAAAPFHTPAVATIGLDGSPTVRTVVLRRFDRDDRTLIFHTDIRSPKVEELRRDDRIMWHFYDAAARLQLRITGRATIHSNDAIADRQWNESRPQSRNCYFQAAGPTTVVKRFDQIGEPVKDGRPHFAAVATKFTTIDRLLLHHAGHRRIRFEFDEAKQAWQSDWLAP